MVTTTINTTLVILVAIVAVRDGVMVIRLMVESFKLMVGTLFNTSSTIIGVTRLLITTNVEP